MAIWWELMGLETANMIGTFSTEEEALTFVSRHLATNGRDAVAHWGLARSGDSEADDLFIAEGDRLINLAQHRHAKAAS